MKSLTLVAALSIALAGSTVTPAAASTPARDTYRAVCSTPAAGSAHCDAKVVTDASGTPDADTLPYGYGPAQLRTAYGLTSAGGGDQTVAIVAAYDDPTVENDLAVYSATYGLPACTSGNGCFHKVNQQGRTHYPQADQSWALEISLDVQAVHAVCPNCRILLVEAASNQLSSLLAAEDYAVSHADVVSNSWGSSEFARETSYDGHFDHPGVPITASSGDNGYGVSWPAASPHVTAVGGTTLTLNDDGTRAGETAWSGAGSGCSAYEPKPAWQTDEACSNRTVADVSADADPRTGAAVYDSYGYSGASGWFQLGGTSLAAPIVAAVYALAGNGPSTTYGSYPYARASALYDITSGNNGWWCGNYLCLAGPGYDGPTGLGTPMGTAAF